MQIAIVGLAGSGKTTVFNTLTRGHAETGGFGGMTVNTGVVKVPDERLTRLTELFKPRREVPADVTYVDLPAPPSLTEGGPPVDIPADQLARLRNADALLHVVRAFERLRRSRIPLGNVDPWRDIEQLELELTAGGPRRRGEAGRQAANVGPAWDAGGARGQRARAGSPRADLPALSDGAPIRDLELSDDERNESAASGS